MELRWDIYNPEVDAPVILAVSSSLGGNATYQWMKVAEQLRTRANTVFIDLPGHALSPIWEDDDPTLDSVASGFMQAIREVKAKLGDKPVVFAGISIAGATALHMARDYSQDLAGVVVLASAATVGEGPLWLERADRVEAEGKGFLLEETMKRWFTLEFRGEQPAIVDIVRESLAGANDFSYAQLCRCLSTHDLRNELSDLHTPLLLIAGERDTSTPIQNVELVAESAPSAELHVVPGVAHQITIADPDAVSSLLSGFLGRVATPVRRAQNDD